jgi:hypothetical protein
MTKRSVRRLNRKRGLRWHENEVGQEFQLKSSARDMATRPSVNAKCYMAQADWLILSAAVRTISQVSL